MSISASFQTLIIRLTPSPTKLTRAKGHAESVRSRLQSSFNLKKFLEYHLDRASAPLIPDLVWKRSEKRLNELWESYRRD